MSRVRKSEGPSQKMGPMKATLPMPLILRNNVYCGANSYNTNLLSSTMRHISPEHSISGHRSPGSMNYKCSEPLIMRRTASLDALYMRPTFNIQPQCTFLQLNKSTQTEDSYLERSSKGSGLSFSPPDLKIEKVIRQRLQRTQRGENSVSSQTLSPVHVKASPVLIPQRPNQGVHHIRPMRNSVEGLNQEIEKLVLVPGLQHTCRPETTMFSRGTPEGRRAPLVDLLHSDTRSVNTQTPIGDMLSSDDSQSTSPEDGASSSGTGASPRINRFLAREPPDGCEKSSFKINTKLPDTIHISSPVTLFKPCASFQLRPSHDSAFKPLQPMPAFTKIIKPYVDEEDTGDGDDCGDEQTEPTNEDEDNRSGATSACLQHDDDDARN